VSSVLCPRQHSIGYMGDGFYRSKDPTNSIKVLKEMQGAASCNEICRVLEINFFTIKMCERKRISAKQLLKNFACTFCKTL